MAGNRTQAAQLDRRGLLAAALGLGALTLGACTRPVPGPDPAPGTPSAQPTPTATGPTAVTPSPSPSPTTVLGREQAIAQYGALPAGEFGLEVPGVQLDLPAGTQAAALTFDACGGAHGSGYDRVLIEALREHRAPATLFINQRWAKANPGIMAELVQDPLFEIANHGTTHAPLASHGQSAYGIHGTASIGEAYDEVMDNQRFLADQYGVVARFFRSGTAHLDEPSARLTRGLGLVPMNFTVNLDAGANLAADAVRGQLAGLGAGDVGIGHFNQPASGTGRGIAAGLPRLLESLRERDLELVRLGEVL